MIFLLDFKTNGWLFQEDLRRFYDRCDIFFQAGNFDNIPPVIPTPHHYLINIYRGDIFFLAVIQAEGELNEPNCSQSAHVVHCHAELLLWPVSEEHVHRYSVIVL